LFLPMQSILPRLSMDSEGRPSLGSGLAFTPGQGTEAGLRLEEWDRQMGSLDSREQELGKAQMKLIREQTATFIRDLSALRQEVVGLKASQVYIEQSIGLANEKMADGLGERVGIIERFIVDSAGRHDAQENALKTTNDVDLKFLQEGLGRLRDAHYRIEYLEKLLGDSTEKQRTELRALKEEQDKYLKNLEDVSKQAAHHASLPERVDYLEKLMGQSADKHLEEITALKAANTRYEAAHGEHAKEWQDLKAANTRYEAAHGEHAKELQDLKANATMTTRLDYFEKMLDDSADKHTREFAALASLPPRMDFLEKLLGNLESAALKRTHVKEDIDTELEGVRSALATLPHRMEHLEKLHEKDLQALQSADDQITRDLLPMLESRPQFEERMDRFEAQLLDIANRSWWC